MIYSDNERREFSYSTGCCSHVNAGRVALKRILALEYVEYNPTGISIIRLEIRPI